jgi:hypothetical protein
MNTHVNQMTEDTQENSPLDWKSLLDAATEEVTRCETALRIVIPFLEPRCNPNEMDEMKMCIRLLRSIRKKFDAPKRKNNQ